ncbi:GFA family protein [Phenylobacterium sp.]|uniref:GFA family protein n=1 Tax=Phenylobacterium sp. TaxID=1871053 RepID=UPI0025EA0793|nr:GFA family protein [Phenylobacterium sp.]
MACHCRGCQQMTGSAFSLSALFAGNDFEVTAGEPVIGGLHGALRHYFCPHCMSWMFTRPDSADAFVNVRAPLFDDPEGLEPFMEAMTAARLSWVSPLAAEQFEGFPKPADYQRLMAAYSSRQVG